MKKNGQKRERYYTGDITDHFDGKRFYNPWDRFGKKGFLDLLKWRMQSKGSEWPLYAENPHKPPLIERSEKLRVTYIGHATMLAQVSNLNILIDPVFSPRASPSKTIGPKRIRDPFVSLDMLPKIDFVFVSHNHYDHLDVESLSWLSRKHKPVIITPLGNARIIKPRAPDCEIITLDWHQKTSLDGKADLWLTPSQHWSRRGLYDINRDLWGGFFLKTKDGQSLYYTGDSGFHTDLFEDIFKRHGSPEIALLPIGAYEPRWFMKYAHMNPEDAVNVYKILKPKRAMAFHFETFPMTDEGFIAPRITLEHELVKANIGGQDFIAPYPGDVLEV